MKVSLQATLMLMRWFCTCSAVVSLRQVDIALQRGAQEILHADPTVLLSTIRFYTHQVGRYPEQPGVKIDRLMIVPHGCHDEWDR